jgi:hypothetical protein
MVLMKNWWVDSDPRLKGLPKISWVISDAFDLASHQREIREQINMEPSIFPIWTPLRLAEEMESAAGRIREMTVTSG